uniref:Uncharacterized protein n=1 Tax=Amphimedon queenslandica TaxID=400682 RepID=A0A1X7T9H9_AMPQE
MYNPMLDCIIQGLVLSDFLKAITLFSSPNENRELLSSPWQQAPPLLPHSVANIGGHILYKIEDTAMYCLLAPTGRPAHPDESKYLKETIISVYLF